MHHWVAVERRQDVFDDAEFFGRLGYGCHLPFQKRSDKICQDNQGYTKNVKILKDLSGHLERFGVLNSQADTTEIANLRVIAYPTCDQKVEYLR